MAVGEFQRGCVLDWFEAGIPTYSGVKVLAG